MTAVKLGILSNVVLKTVTSTKFEVREKKIDAALFSNPSR